MSLAGIILAAGASRRMGVRKALLLYQGETFLDRLIGLLAAECSPVLVVLDPAGDAVRARLSREAQAQFVVNPDPARGQFSSLQCALRALPEEAEGFLFTPVDHPAVMPATLAALVTAFRGTGAPVVAPRYQGCGGHPVCCSRELAAEMLAEPPHSQARAVIRRHAAHIHHLDVEDPGVLEDVDDPIAYARLRRRDPSA